MIESVWLNVGLHLTSVIILAVLLLFIKKTNNYMFTPAGVLASSWFILIFLKLVMATDYYYSPASASFILGFIFLFAFGEYLSKAFLDRNKLLASPGKDFVQSFTTQRFERTLKFFAIFFSLVSITGSLLYFRVFIVYFGSFQEFLVGGTVLRDAFFDGDIGVPFYINVMALVSYSAVNLALIYYVKFSFRWFVLLPFLAVLIMSFAQAARAGIVIMIFQVMSAYIIKSMINKKPKLELKVVRPVLIVGIFFFVLFVSIQAFRAQEDILDVATGDIGVPFFKMYLFGGISGFTAYVEQKYHLFQELTWGRYTFSSLYNLLGIYKQEKGIYDDYLPVTNGQIGNVYSIMRPTLDDFGIIGFLIIPIIVGFACNIVYKKSMSGDLRFASLLLSIFTYLFFSITAPLTQFNSFILSLFLAPFLIHFARIKFKLK